MMKYGLLLIALLFSQCSLAIVGGHEYVFDDGTPLENETRAQLFEKLAVELRCPKCQNQNLADSNGDSIIDFMVDRYGEFVLYRPQVNAMTYVLWFGPVGLLVVGLICLVFIVRKRKQSETVSQDLSIDQQKRINELLEKDKGDDHV